MWVSVEWSCLVKVMINLILDSAKQNDPVEVASPQLRVSPCGHGSQEASIHKPGTTSTVHMSSKSSEENMLVGATSQPPPPLESCIASHSTHGKQTDLAKDGVEPSNLAQSASEAEELIKELFPSVDHKLIHYYQKCRDNNCTSISKIDKDRQSHLKDKFNHAWLSSKSSFCHKTGIWWCVYVEGQGMYCVLCRKHKCINERNRNETFYRDPSTRYKINTIIDHTNSKKHDNAVSTELTSRVSQFQKQIDEKTKVQDEVLVKAFTTLYWLAKEIVANRKAASLITLIEKLGVSEMKYFTYSSPASLREMLLTIASVIQDNILKLVNEAGVYGLLVDDMTDISVIEQMITFIQFFNHDIGEVQTSFLFIQDVLQKSESADAKSLLDVLTSKLDEFSLDIQMMRGLVTDGASVMVGKRSGLATQLKAINSKVLSIHCICHRLALACTDTLKTLQYIKEVEIIATQLWRMFENSPKKLAVYLKCQQEIKAVSLSTDNARTIVSRRLKRACQTRWLSFDSAIKSVYDDIIAILHTLRKLKSDPTAYGLLKKMSNIKFVGTVYILRSVLPILADLSKVFQRGTINYASIAPAILRTKDRLFGLLEDKAPIRQLQIDLAVDGRLGMLHEDIKYTDEQITHLHTRLRRYVSALNQNIDNRLENAIPILQAFSIFDPTSVPDASSPTFDEYGITSLNVLAEYLHGETESYDVKYKQMVAEWQKLKYDIIALRKDMPSDLHKANITPSEWLASRIVQMKWSYGHLYPELVKVCQIFLSVPVSNAWPERGASKVKLIKNRMRSRLLGDITQALLQITLNGPDLYTPNCDGIIKAAVEKWNAAKKRRKLPKIPVTPVCQKSEEPVQEGVTEMEEASTQTDHRLSSESIACQAMDSLDSVEEEVDNALAVLKLMGNEIADCMNSDSDSGWDSDD